MGLRAHCRECLGILNKRSTKDVSPQQSGLAKKLALDKWRKSLTIVPPIIRRKNRSSKITLRSPRNKEIVKNKIVLHLIRLRHNIHDQ